MFYAVLEDRGIMPKGGRKSSPRKRPAATGFTSDEGSTGEDSARKRRRIVNEKDLGKDDPVPEPPKPAGSEASSHERQGR